MHVTAYETAKCFFNTYCVSGSSVVEIGSQNVNGSIKDHATMAGSYVGVDFANANGVDVVLKDPYKFPFEDNTFDVLVTSSCFEHSEMFWLTFLEGLRIVKPDGILYCNAPSNVMPYHRYPVDCWRFMPDAAKGLLSWAQYNNINSAVLESFIVCPIENDGNPSFDWCSVFIKDKKYMDKYKNRMIDKMTLNCVNIFTFYPNSGDWNSPRNGHDLMLRSNIISYRGMAQR